MLVELFRLVLIQFNINDTTICTTDDTIDLVMSLTVSGHLPYIMSIVIHLCIRSPNRLTRLFVGLSSEEAGGAGAGGRSDRNIDARLV